METRARPESGVQYPCYARTGQFFNDYRVTKQMEAS